MTNSVTAPNGYLPISVHYSRYLSAEEKILFAEITALTFSKGQCCADKKYFSRVLHLDEEDVSKYLKNLERLGHIEIHRMHTSISEAEKCFIQPNMY